MPPVASSILARSPSARGGGIRRCVSVQHGVKADEIRPDEHPFALAEIGAVGDDSDTVLQPQAAIYANARRVCATLSSSAATAFVSCPGTPRMRGVTPQTFCAARSAFMPVRIPSSVTPPMMLDVVSASVFALRDAHNDDERFCLVGDGVQ